jgi:hypothetical protein
MLIITLLISGIMAGGINFFVSYLDLPFLKTPDQITEDDWPKPKSLWLAVVGYLFVGIAGAFLTPLLNVLIVLKGYNPEGDYLVAFGYGLVFGYSTSKLLVTILDSILKKISKIENRLKKIDSLSKSESPIILTIAPNAQKVIDECEAQFETYKSDCSGFVKAVSKKFSVTLTGQADDIVDQIQGAGWTVLADGVTAKAKADLGWLVIGGLKAIDHTPPRNNGHAVVVVSGALASNKYPTGYWGSLGSVGKKNTTINYAWVAADRDNVIYSGRAI